MDKAQAGSVMEILEREWLPIFTENEQLRHFNSVYKKRILLMSERLRIVIQRFHDADVRASVLEESLSEVIEERNHYQNLYEQLQERHQRQQSIVVEDRSRLYKLTVKNMKQSSRITELEEQLSDLKASNHIREIVRPTVIESNLIVRRKRSLGYSTPEDKTFVKQRLSE